MQKGDITYRIIGCAMKVHGKLGRGFREYIYCRAMAIELRREGIPFEREVWLPIHYDTLRIGYRRCDFAVAPALILELKAKGEMGNEDLVQAINTLECLNGTNGLLINFGASSLQYKHIFNNNVRPTSAFTDATAEQLGEASQDIFESRHYLPDWEVEQRLKDQWVRQKKGGGSGGSGLAGF